MYLHLTFGAFVAAIGRAFGAVFGLAVTMFLGGLVLVGSWVAFATAGATVHYFLPSTPSFLVPASFAWYGFAAGVLAFGMYNMALGLTEAPEHRQQPAYRRWAWALVSMGGLLSAACIVGFIAAWAPSLSQTVLQVLFVAFIAYDCYAMHRSYKTYRP